METFRPSYYPPDGVHCTLYLGPDLWSLVPGDVVGQQPGQVHVVLSGQLHLKDIQGSLLTDIKYS